MLSDFERCRILAYRNIGVSLQGIVNKIKSLKIFIFISGRMQLLIEVQIHRKAENSYEVLQKFDCSHDSEQKNDSK